MINTYSNSLPAPPVPPRTRGLGLVPGRDPVAVPLPAPEPQRTKSHICFLAVVFVLHVVVTTGLFVYLFGMNLRTRDNKDAASDYYDAVERLRKGNADKADSRSLLECLNRSEKLSRVAAEVPEARSGTSLQDGWGAVAHMKGDRASLRSRNTLLWMREHSLLRNVDHFSISGMLQVRLTGYYYIYSQVTFSKELPNIPLSQTVKRWGTSPEKPDQSEGEILLKAFCNWTSKMLCTSFQGGVFKLEKGQKLSVTVADTSLVNFDEKATTFGLFLLQQTD
ncbi:CD40 ligand [Arapaima gigas]